MYNKMKAATDCEGRAQFGSIALTVLYFPLFLS